jgi:hypothetical protein
MLRKELYRKMYAGAVLMAFCVLLLMSQVTNLKIQNTKFGKVSPCNKTSQGPTSLPTNENQTNPINNPEEEDDEFNLESSLVKVPLPEFFGIRHYSFEEDPLRDPHRKIFSPPPQS